MRASKLLLAMSLLALPAQAQQHPMRADPDQMVKGGGTLPAGWSARTDRDAPLDNVKFVTMGDGWHATMGPAAIFYRGGDKASGSYTLTATFTQTKAPTHPEAFGLFFGGSNLSADNQQYTYFLVRGDGKFLVKRRTGATTANVADWTPNAAAKAQDEAGKCTNTLTVKVTPSAVAFEVNGTEVYRAKLADVDAAGIYGLRVNHNLDVHVAGFGVK